MKTHYLLWWHFTFILNRYESLYQIFILSFSCRQTLLFAFLAPIAHHHTPAHQVYGANNRVCMVSTFSAHWKWKNRTSLLYSSLIKSVTISKQVQIPLKIMAGQESHCRDAQRDSRLHCHKKVLLLGICAIIYILIQQYFISYVIKNTSSSINPKLCPRSKWVSLEMNIN